jgi:cellobiose phosphorylase
MKANGNALVRQALRFRAVSRSRKSFKHLRNESPLRLELFSADQMEGHGKALAAAHELTPHHGPDQLLPRLAANETVLIDACAVLTTAVSLDRPITPAGEWLLDNFYLIEEQIRLAKRHLPKAFSRELPRLASGASAGLPRVYDIALEVISHADGRVDQEILTRFLTGYQTVTSVTLGELWAIPIMLRLALIENLRRVATDVAAGRIDRDLADDWVDQLRNTAQADPTNLILVIADMARSDPPLTTAFVSELSRRLQGRGPALALALTWVEQRLSESHVTIDRLVQTGIRQQAASQGSVSNSIGSLRFIGAMDWRRFVESRSVVEQKLREDPHGVYGNMDFFTRDRYRHAVEELAKQSRRSEAEVARAAVELSQERASGHASASGSGTDHVGFYLIDAGRPLLEQALGARGSAVAALKGLGSRFATFIYLSAIFTLSGLLTAGMTAMAYANELPVPIVVLVGIVSLVAASQLAVELINWCMTLLVAPQRLPRMDFSRGIAPGARALVAVPTMLSSVKRIEALVEALEIRYLANRDANLCFALLTDFVDASEETMPGDAELLHFAQTSIEALNAKYGDSKSRDTTADAGPAFHLLHRPRTWNARERLWMGYERKRGKLGALNALLRGEPDAAKRFSSIVGPSAALVGIKYVITLDSDTELPRDAARELVSAMAHPLNRPRYDDTRLRVTRGYGILQPRVATSLVGSNRSWFARIFGGDSGIDPYTRTVSDAYQDAFGEGSFIGKGVYDVDAFEMTLKGRFPENLILSHDLLEGSYVRSGLITDVQLYEEYPSLYSDDVKRRRRWIRGDWQIAPWLLRRVPGPNATRSDNPLSMLSQWKLLDNLRRSLVPPALLLLLLSGWTLLVPAWWWTLAVLGILFLPALAASLLDLLQKPADVPLPQHLASTSRTTMRRAIRIGFSLACLPYEAYFTTGAILRAHWRALVTGKRLLEWTASAEESAGEAGTLLASYRSMWAGPLVAIVAAGDMALANPAVLAFAAPVLLLWLLSPALAWWMSRPLSPRITELTPGQTVFLRNLARRTWAYFETFVGPAHHWLPPDNYQEAPVDRVAHRTSPTNMGMALLADLAAYDFGYLPAGRLVERIGSMLRTLQSLEKHQGHFYNWYDTQSFQALPARYVSSVDSANLAAHLMTLGAGLRALPEDAILDLRVIEGFGDTTRVLVESLRDIPTRGVPELCRIVDAAQEARPATAYALRRWLDELETAIALVATNVDGSDAASESPHAESEPRAWIRALKTHCRSAKDELRWLAPWTEFPALEATLTELAVAGPIPGLRELADVMPALTRQIARLQEAAATAAERGRLDEAARLVTAGCARANERIAAIDELSLRCEELAAGMEFGFLYDSERHLFAVGYNVEERQRDSSYYDLLASEARLASFVAIAQGQVPQENWFALGRLLSSAGGRATLLSWSGSMFEYLMPLLVMPTYENTLLDESCRGCVERQIAYGRALGVPWGISESGYNTLDANLNYQYRAFGVPELGLNRGLGDDIVIAPYASMLALMLSPDAACRNLQRLASEGLAGRFGLFEAIDYTARRLPRGQSGVVIRSFMAHHQGMTLLALGHFLLDRRMQKRFESDPRFQATLLLLQERIPKSIPLLPHLAQLTSMRAKLSEPIMPMRVITTPQTPVPEVQLLSNGRYHVMITNAGSGSSRWNDLALTRWHEDTTCDNWGTYCYLRDVASGKFWSTSHQPVCAPADHYEAIFSEGRAEFRRRDGDYDVHTEIAVSPEDDIELRRTRIVSRARERTVIEVTSYAEIVLSPPAADAAHPAFSKLFVETEIADAHQAILCTRRPRSPGERTRWMFHRMAMHGATPGVVSYETDRIRFIGRGNTLVSPRAMLDDAPLSGSAGPVLDPVAAIRMLITLEPNETATIDMVYGVADSRDAALGLVEKYGDPRLADRVVDLAWTHAHVVLRQINAGEADAQMYARLANCVLYANGSLRADPAVISKNRRGQSGLWGYAISGDWPIVLLRIADAANIELVRQLVQAHAYWRVKGLVVDLVIWNEEKAGYRQLLQDQIMGLISARVEAQMMDRPGGIFVRRAEQIAEEDRVLLESVARVIIADRNGTLADQIGGRASRALRIPRFVPTRELVIGGGPAKTPPRELILGNGIGGFTADGAEYIITTDADHLTPAPWVNVLANPYFGAIISESGAGYTWGENAHEFRLTPWSNDPVSDTGGEAYYLRDEETGRFWSPTPLPARGSTPYVTRHGFGYTVFEHDEDGIVTELCVHVAHDAPVKFTTLKIRNASGRARRISVTGYVEWVLGDLRPKSVMHVVAESNIDTGALFARNAYSTDFSDRVAFFDVDDTTLTHTCDRAEFMGRNGTMAAPAAMTRSRLSGASAPGLDPCAAIQVMRELNAGAESEVTFRLGVGRDGDEAKALVQRFRGAAAAGAQLESVQRHWQQTLRTIRIETPDESLNVLCNGWLVYQVLSSRLWGRSGFYQSGGAFGFRDQLQDVLALVHAEPHLTREQILLSASRQFVEGDVQHWWHPPSGRGVRTRCSDDYLWLPLAIARYVSTVGDIGVLDQPTPFLEGRAVNPGEDSYYDLPSVSSEVATLYDHGVRAILHGLRFGSHGLPLMGSGDWNDGMNQVGIEGRGESVWLAFFLCFVLGEFAKVARLRGDGAFAERCDHEASVLGRNIDQHGWDGEWYRRAYFDDGSPLGSAANAECQIDSIAQSWSVLSGIGDAKRSRAAMDAVYRRLVRRDDALVLLLTPPFDHSSPDPGYIMGYVPGVRENGGQYTHAAVWTVMAFAAMGDAPRAWELMDMINPVRHALTAAGVATYRIEPYVVAADVYARPPHTGRGGWSWYTGSAGWMYRLIVESLLGVELAVDKLRFSPRLPGEWKEFRLHYRYRKSVYHVTVSRGESPDHDFTVWLDGVAQAGNGVPLLDDGIEHDVRVLVPSLPVADRRGVELVA